MHLQGGRHGGCGPRSWYKNIESLIDFKNLHSGSNKEAFQDDNESFLVQAAFGSTFVPSVVGRQSQKLFLKNGILSLVNKVFLIVLALVLAYTGLSVHPRPLFNLCFEENSTYVQENNFTAWSISRDNCNEERNQIETPFQIWAFSGLLVTVLVAVCSTYELHKRADYQVIEI